MRTGSGPFPTYQRNEPDAQRLDRNYGELLQELRVVLTGVQILFAFLLSIAFQQRFAHVGVPERVVYVLALASSAGASVLLTAPAAVHRVLFRYNVKDEIVDVTAGLVKAGLAFLALAMVTGLGFVVSFVAGPPLGLVLGGALAVLVAATWLVAPRRRRLRRVMAEPDLRPAQVALRPLTPGSSTAPATELRGWGAGHARPARRRR
jgi:hypothetical protein